MTGELLLCWLAFIVPEGARMAAQGEKSSTLQATVMICMARYTVEAIMAQTMSHILLEFNICS